MWGLGERAHSPNPKSRKAISPPTLGLNDACCAGQPPPAPQQPAAPPRSLPNVCQSGSGTSGSSEAGLSCQRARCQAGFPEQCWLHPTSLGYPGSRKQAAHKIGVQVYSWKKQSLALPPSPRKGSEGALPLHTVIVLFRAQLQPRPTRRRPLGSGVPPGTAPRPGPARREEKSGRPGVHCWRDSRC